MEQALGWAGLYALIVRFGKKSVSDSIVINAPGLLFEEMARDERSGLTVFGLAS
jgi:hypothetical protein